MDEATKALVAACTKVLVEGTNYEHALDVAAEQYRNAKTPADKKKVVDAFVKASGERPDKAEGIIQDTIWDQDQND
jgi:hypothetical protein